MANPMMCPVCGVAMNHHADKMMYEDSGEAIEEFHSCPNCGRTESRAAESSPADLDAYEANASARQELPR